MSAVFLSVGWFSQAIARINQESQVADALAGWRGDFGFVIAGSHAIYLGSPVDGQLPEPHSIEFAFLARRNPKYLAEADATTWREMLMGQLDPIAAIVTSRLKVKGDLEQLVKNLHLRGVATRWIENLRSELTTSAET
jgi:SCP-2 sterol transfer family